LSKDGFTRLVESTHYFGQWEEASGIDHLSFALLDQVFGQGWWDIATVIIWLVNVFDLPGAGSGTLCFNPLPADIVCPAEVGL
jgi:hypothetical protein